MLYTCHEPKRGGTEAALQAQFQASREAAAVSHVQCSVECYRLLRPLPRSASQHDTCHDTCALHAPMLQEHSLFSYNEQLTWRKLGRLLLIPTNVLVISQVRCCRAGPERVAA